MMKKASNIMEEKVMTVDVLSGVRRIQNVFHDQGIECFSVYEDGKVVGVVTKKELVGAHPNRIIADVMSNKHICIRSSAPVWEIKEILDFNKDIDTIFVENRNQIAGYITREILNTELAKSIDLLTGLYKIDYIFYNAYHLFKNKQHVSIIFIDLDNFGCIDKKYGHRIGDAILKEVADILKENIDSNSFLCRYAGDEFAIATSYSINDSKIFAEDIMNAIHSHVFPNKIPVSVSIGITGCHIHNRKIDNISEVIDSMMNVASLLSTKAKQENCDSIIARNVDIDAIA